MSKTLAERLHLDMEPIGVFFANTEAVCDFSPTAETRNCVVPLLMAAAKGK